METSQILDAIRVASAVLVLGYASFLDVRTRKVGNLPWIVLSLAASVLLLSQIAVDDQPLEYFLVLIPIVSILCDVYVDFGDGAVSKVAPWMAYGIAIVALIALGYLWAEDEHFQYLLAVPVMMLVIVVFYMLDIVRGGADAKALLALSIMFPFYPQFDSIPLISVPEDSSTLFFPFTFMVLVMAAIAVAFVPVGFLVKNAVAKELQLPYAALGYKMDTAKAKDKHVWLMERMDQGNHILHARPRRQEDLEKELRLLEDAGHRRVWVTPKIPFIPMILGGLAFVVVVGNIFFLLFD